ncbi:MAG: TylF/MycF family methyltransferase [Granulosicoccus sp.]|nr:TylF/MycF family methyltransferase [Granulosicoccus sp.]
MGSFKSHVENTLRRYPPLFRLGSRVYHTFNGSFKTLSPGTPQALYDSFELAKQYANGESVGDYYEFGLFRGYTLLEAYKHSQNLGVVDTHFYGFDSFEGLPAADNEHDKQDGRFFEGQFACSLAKVEENLRSNGMDMSKVDLIKGYYKDSLTEELRTHHNFRNAGVVLLDCDYYSSTREALDWIEPYLKNNTILLFDDWYSYGDSDELGQQRALQEFLEKNEGYSVEPLAEFIEHGKSFVLKKQ